MRKRPLTVTLDPDSPGGNLSAAEHAHRVSFANVATEEVAWAGAVASERPRPAAGPLSTLFRSSSLSSTATFVPVLERTASGGFRKSAPVEFTAFDVPALSPKSLAGRFIKFKNCRIVRGHALVREDLWIRCAVASSPSLPPSDAKLTFPSHCMCSCIVRGCGFVCLWLAVQCGEAACRAVACACVRCVLDVCVSVFAPPRSDGRIIDPVCAPLVYSHS